MGDPTCGSGRLLLAYHAHNPGNYLVGEDISRTCCMMTVCNMLMHGCVGEVIHHDSLVPDSFLDGWYVNPFLTRTGIPCIRKMSEADYRTGRRLPVNGILERKKLLVENRKRCLPPNRPAQKVPTDDTILLIHKNKNMKLNASNELKSRLTHAAANGSVIAADILTEMKRNADVSEIIRGGYNFFSTKRKRTGGASYQKIRSCSPHATRTEQQEFPGPEQPAGTLVPRKPDGHRPFHVCRLFRNLPEYPETELSYFSSAICVDSKVTVQLHGKHSINSPFHSKNVILLL